MVFFSVFGAYFKRYSRLFETKRVIPFVCAQTGHTHRDVMQSGVAMVYADARRNTSDQVGADALRAVASAGSVEEVRRVLALNPGCVDLRELGGVRRTALMIAGEDLSPGHFTVSSNPSHILVTDWLRQAFEDCTQWCGWMMHLSRRVW